jgi:hypothetical protein
MKQWCLSLFFTLACGSSLFSVGVDFPLGKQDIGTVTFMQYGHNQLWLVANTKLYVHNGYDLKAVEDSFLLNKAIESIYVTDSGLYIGFLSDGIGFYHPRKRRAYAIFTPKQGYPVLPDLRIGYFFLENDTSLWVQTHHQGLTIIHKKKPVYYNYPTSKFAPSQDRGAAIVDRVVPHQSLAQHYWVATLGGLFLIDLEKGNYVDFIDLKAVKNNGELPNNNRENSLRNILIVDNTAWLGTWSGGLIELDLLTKTIKKYDIPRPKRSNRAINIRQMWQVSPQKLRVSSSAEGVWDFDITTHKFTRAILPDTWPAGKMPHSTLVCALGTFYGGENILHLEAKKDWPWKTVFNANLFLKLNEGQAPAALLKEGVAQNLNSQARTLFSGNLPGSYFGWHDLEHGNWAFVEREAVKLWYNNKWLDLGLYWRETSPFKGEIISSYYNRETQTLNLGTAGVGVRKYQLNSATWTELASPQLKRFWIKAFATLGQGMCIANEQQLHFYHNNQPQKIIDLKKINSLPKGAIISKIWWLKANELWVLFNRAGLVKINLQSQQVKLWIKPRAQVEENFYDVAFSANGIYIGTKKGLLWQSNRGEKRLFGSSYGLKEISQISLSNNTLWLNHNGELLKWQNPQPQTLPTYLPKPHLNDFNIMGQNAALDTVLTLPHYKNWLEWAVVPSSFVNPGEGTVQLRLEGFTKQWRGIDGQNYSISNLSHGDYKLLGRTLSAEGEIGPAEVIMKVSILPAWYQSWWFFVGLILTVSTLLYSIYRFRMLQLREKQAIENRYLDELRGLEMRMLRVQMNPHFIFNALNSVRYYILKQDRKTASEYLTRFAKLLRFILNISKQEQVSLAQELEGIEHYVKFEQLRFDQGFNFELELNFKQNAASIAIQPMLIQPFLENAIWHGLMPLAEKGTLILNISTAKQHLVITVEDNGVGRAAADLNQRKAKKSHGLSITKDRLEALAKNTGEAAHFKIIDKMVENKPTGTRVEIVVPFKNIKLVKDQ